MIKLSAAIIAIAVSLTGILPCSAESLSADHRFSVSQKNALAETSTSAERNVTLCYATADSSEFTRITRTLNAETTETLIRSMLSELVVANSYIDISGGFHTADVPDFELSCGTLTVNLPVETLSGRTEQELFSAETALANSLLDIEEVTAVNILFDGQASDLYALPIGVFTNTVESAKMLYADLEAQQTASLSSDTVVDRTILLYLPQDEFYLLPTAVSIESNCESWPAVVLESFAKASGMHFSLILEPEIKVTQLGERVLNLDFEPLSEDISLGSFCAAITLTLSSFLPDLASVRITFAGESIETLDLPGGTTFKPIDSCFKRSMFTGLIGSIGHLYLKNSNDRLTAVGVPMGMHTACTPIGLLATLFKTNTYSGCQSCIPAGIDSSDILSVGLENTCAIVDLSANFYTRCQALDESGERLLVYSMINTLTSLPGIDSVRFTIEGEEIGQLVHSICLSSDLMPDPGIADN